MRIFLIFLSVTVSANAAGIFDFGKFHKRQGDVRVDVTECAVDAHRRTDCGYIGITEGECISRDCCWVESDRPGVPWCYHTLSQSHEVCVMHESEREDCGYYGINPEQCEGNGCCWQPTQEARTPWCFHPSGPIPNSGERGCGSPVITPSVSSRIVGGVDAIPHSWPWQISFQRGTGTHGGCGGSLIAPQWVVTAAHCSGLFEGTIVLGLHYGANHSPVTEEIDIEFSLVHEDYNRTTTSNDIALIKLAREVTYRDEISPVCLPREEPREGTECYVTGWGRLKSGGEMADVLQQVMVPIVNRYTCNDWYSGQITDAMICAGEEEGGYDSCQGDSGGPFVCSDEGHWVLSGIVSWGIGCAYEQKPGIYTNVAMFLPWIDRVMAENA